VTGRGGGVELAVGLALLIVAAVFLYTGNMGVFAVGGGIGGIVYVIFDHARLGRAIIYSLSVLSVLIGGGSVIYYLMHYATTIAK